jgi:hypothetical protein
MARSTPPSSSNQILETPISPKSRDTCSVSEASGIAPQPETRPISQEQLVAEVKGIYAGLVMVEGKCIQVDLKQAALARDAPPGSPPKLNDEQWQALIALHRTLLHEHHDFFLASQHPSATPAVRRLANKYAMPARLWRHAIHSFLELLRNRLPESMDHMLAFIYLAYSMMTLLYETVPAFEETWIECLGDLGRYRMAIEDDDIGDREVWTQVARQWYLKALDRSPQTGRLYHHLAILARPNALQQLYFYSMAVSVPHPFAAAKDSMVPFEGTHSSLITTYIEVHVPVSQKSFTPIAEFIRLLDNHMVTPRFLEEGYYIAITNCNAILTKIMLSESLTATKGSESNTSRIMVEYVQIFNQTAEIVLRVANPYILSYMHVLLIFMVHVARFPSAMSFLEKGFPWQHLVKMLNTLLESYSTHSRIEGDAMPIPEKDDFRPTPEEFAMHGLFWADKYFPPDWFSNKNFEYENKEASINTEYRTERILWLSCKLARSGKWISYKNNRFFVPGNATHSWRIISGLLLLFLLGSFFYDNQVSFCSLQVVNY